MSKNVSASVSDFEIVNFVGPAATHPLQMQKLFEQRGIKFHPRKNAIDLTETPRPVEPFTMARDIKRQCVTIRQVQDDEQH